MRLVNSGSRLSIGLRALAFGAGIVAIGCGTNGESSGSSTPTSGTVCVSSDGTVTTGTTGDVQLGLCTDWTCEQLAAQSEGSIKCTAPQPPGTSIPPGGYDCASDEGGLYCPPGAGHGSGGNGGWVCVANESMLTCTSGGSGGGSGTGGSTGSGGSTGAGGSCVIGDESCGQTGEGGSGGSTLHSRHRGLPYGHRRFERLGRFGRRKLHAGRRELRRDRLGWFVGNGRRTRLGQGWQHGLGRFGWLHPRDRGLPHGHGRFDRLGRRWR